MKMDRRRRAGALVFAALLAVAPPRDAAAQLEVRFDRSDPRRCVVSGLLDAPRAAVARRCAELFVRLNGYTDEPVADSALVVPESVEYGMEIRRGRLRLPAARAWCDESGCMVVFAYARSADPCQGRVVRMTTGFARVEVVHQDYALAPGTAPARGC